MNKKAIAIGVIFILVGTGIYIKDNVIKNKAETVKPTTTVFDPKSLDLKIEGNKATYFGNEARGDLDGDGLEDVAFLVTSEGGGSGTFYYAIVAIQTSEGYKLTNPFFVGDRIAPQSNFIPKNSRELQINYAERRPAEPMTTPPSQGAVLLLKVTDAGILEGLMK